MIRFYHESLAVPFCVGGFVASGPPETTEHGSCLLGRGTAFRSLVSTLFLVSEHVQHFCIDDEERVQLAKVVYYYYYYYYIIENVVVFPHQNISREQGEA